MSIFSAFSASLQTVLTTVEVVANKTTAVVVTSANGLDMLDNLVTKAKQDQADDYVVHRRDYRNKLIMRASEENAAEIEQLEKRLAHNPILAKHFNTEFAAISALFEPPVNP